jgi:hypothetical protein
MIKFLKRLHPFEITLILVVITIHLYAAFSDAYNFPNYWFTRDDAYYYFKVAQNITEGHGSTFDGINHTNGYHPLWMVVCVPIFALARFDLILPLRILLVVMGGFSAVTAVLIYRLVRENLSQAVAIIAASFWAFNFHIHYIIYEFGLETPLAAFSIVLFIYKLSHFERSWRKNGATSRQIAVLGGLAVLVLFSRLDLIFLAFIAGLWIILRGHPMRSLLPMDIAVFFLSMTVSVALRTGIRSYNQSFASSALEAALIAMAIKITTLYLFGAYREWRAGAFWKKLTRIAAALAVSSVMAAGLYLAAVQLGVAKDFPRSAFAIDWVISTSLLIAIRLIEHVMRGAGEQVGQIPTTALEDIRANWRPWFKDGSIYYGILGGALGTYMLFNKLFFGTFSPVSGQIKRWWGTIGNTVYDYPAPNWPAFLGISQQGVYAAWQPLSGWLAGPAHLLRPLIPGAENQDERYLITFFICMVIGLTIVLLNSRLAAQRISNMALIPLGAGCIVHVLSYTTTAYGGAKEWYWVSELILIVLAGSILLDVILQPLQGLQYSRTGLQFVSLGMGVYLAVIYAGQVRATMLYNFFPADRPLMEVLPYIEENTPPGSMIGMTGGGNVGYFIHDRTIVNMDGLINSYEYFKAVQNGTAPSYLYDHGMQIAFVNPRLLDLPPYYGQFRPYLESYGVYGGKDLMYLWEEPKYPQQ